MECLDSQHREPLRLAFAIANHSPPPLRLIFQKTPPKPPGAEQPESHSDEKFLHFDSIELHAAVGRVEDTGKGRQGMGGRSPWGIHHFHATLHATLTTSEVVGQMLVQKRPTS